VSCVSVCLCSTPFMLYHEQTGGTASPCTFLLVESCGFVHTAPVSSPNKETTVRHRKNAIDHRCTMDAPHTQTAVFKNLKGGSIQRYKILYRHSDGVRRCWGVSVSGGTHMAVFFNKGPRVGSWINRTPGARTKHGSSPYYSAP